MNKQSIGDKVFSNFLWRWAERSGAQLVGFVVSIILARLLEPSMYGIIALVTVFTSILQVFVDSGLGNSLIQKKDADNIDFSTVFYTNIVFCLLLYTLLFFCAPMIADFYNMPDLTPVVRVMGLTIVISGVKNIQQAYVSKHMIFKRFFFATLGGTIGAAVIGIVMAYFGFGVWALVAQNLFNLTVDTIILWITVKWRPQLVFSFKRLKRLYSYGWKLLAASLVQTVYLDIRQLLIGKFYAPESLALYNRGKQIPEFIAKNINNSIDSVLFPAMASAQRNREMVKKMTRMSIRVSSYIMWPCMLGLAAISEPFVRLLLTEKWIGCVPFLRIFCITVAFQPLNTANLNAIKALGRSDIVLILEIIKKTIGLIILIAVLRFGVFAICCSLLLYNLIATLANAWPNRKLLGYTYSEQFKDIFTSVGLSLIMGLPVYLISYLPLPDIIILVMQGLSGVVIYIGLSKLFKLDTFAFVLDRVKGLFNKNNK